MKQIGKSLNSVRVFTNEVHTELKKCAWPSRQELMDSTVVVIVSVAILGAYVGLSDSIISLFLRLVIR